MAAVETVKFFFDTRCGWTYQASRWIRRVEELGLLELDWGVFSLEVLNAPAGADLRAIEAESGPALRTAMKIRELKGSKAIGPFYKAVGRRRWEQDPPVADLSEAVRAALAEIGLDPALLDEAMADPATWGAVLADHRWLLENTRATGVPTVILDGGSGPAIFGPVISALPSDEDAVELWEHVSWLARYENFSELKRGRVSNAVLPARAWWHDYRRRERERLAAAQS